MELRDPAWSKTSFQWAAGRWWSILSPMQSNWASGDSAAAIFWWDKKLISRLPLCKSRDNRIKRTCIAVDVELIISAASRKAFAAFRSPLAAMTLARDSRAASASAAMGRCIWIGRLTSFLEIWRSISYSIPRFGPKRKQETQESRRDG